MLFWWGKNHQLPSLFIYEPASPRRAFQPSLGIALRNPWEQPYLFRLGCVFAFWVSEHLLRKTGGRCPSSAGSWINSLQPITRLNGQDTRLLLAHTAPCLGSHTGLSPSGKKHKVPWNQQQTVYKADCVILPIFASASRTSRSLSRVQGEHACPSPLKAEKVIVNSDISS